MSETDDLDRLAPDTVDEADAFEQRVALDEAGDPVGAAPMPDDANAADAAEQRAALDEAGDRVDIAPIPDDANEADVAEQSREVPVDEDDYR